MSDQTPDRPVVLFVDDDEMARLLQGAPIQRAGLRVVEAVDGEEALRKFAAEAPDLVLLDINMPGMDGYECCRRLRALPGGAGVPILMLSGQDDDETLHKAFDAGATDFAAKYGDYGLVAWRVRFLLRAARRR